ncbi:nitrate/nitrite transporter [Erysipelothrix urinaevulpis]|uniref:MFS transporter n=1 Tax=Erysipelothrix urinaevulpis TaxID=2683717 RepID=UPI001357ED18|nr:MFS transporter [Erysipelothrix urinaevulpis]
MEMSQGKKYFLVGLLGFMFSAAYLLPYIKYVFNDALIAGLGITNQQSGMLLSVYAVINAITLIPGGYISDKYSQRKIITVSALGTGIITIIFAFNMNYTMALITWTVLGFTTIFAFWGSVIKAVRMLGTEDEQGRLYGFYAGFQGVVNTVVALGAAYVFSLFAAQADGLKSVLIMYGSLNILGAVMFWVLYPKELDVSDENAEPISVKDLITVLKMPATWLLSLIIFSIYGVFSGSTLMTSYVTDVLLITGTVGTLIAIFRTYIARAIFSPVGGILSDKTKKPSKNIMISSIITAALIVVLMLFGKQLGNIGALLVIIASSITIYMNFGVMWATSEELKIPRKLYGSVIGVASIIGYAPDFFMHAMFGSWIDQHGADGYRFIFMFLIFLALIGVVTSFVISQKSKKEA